MNQIKCLIFSFVLLSFSLYSQDQGVQFVDKPWEEVLAIAKEENKLIFVDMYADWCVPCKVMEEEIFTYDEVGNKYNESFISTRLDVDQAEGSMISLRYGVSSLPGLLFLTPDETLVYKLNGYQGISELLVEHDKAINPNLRIQAWNKRYREGDRNSSFLYSYAVFSDSIKSPIAEQLYDDYLIAEHDWLSPEASAIVFRKANGVHDSTFIFILENEEFFRSNFPADLIQSRIYDKVDAEGESLLKASNFEDLISLYSLAYGEEGLHRAMDMELQYAIDKRDVTYLVSVLQKYLDQPYTNEGLVEEAFKRLNQIASTEEDFAMIEKFYRNVLTSHEDPRVMSELASIYVKNNQWSDAVSISKSAYKAAKSQKLDNWKSYKKAYKSIKKQAKKAS